MKRNLLLALSAMIVMATAHAQTLQVNLSWTAPGGATTITAGTGFSLFSKQLSFGILGEYNTATTSTSIGFAMPSGANTVLGQGIVIKQGPAGTAPTGKGVEGITTEQFVTTAPTMYIPCQIGNLQVGMVSSGNTAVFVSSATGSSGSWTARVKNTTNNMSQIIDNLTATCSSSLTVTPTFAATCANGCQTVWVSFYGAADSFITSNNNSYNQTTAANVALGSITPTAANQFVVAMSSVSWHTLTGATSGVFLASTDNKDDDADSDCTLATPNSTLFEDDIWWWELSPNTTAITPTFTGTQTGSCSTHPTGVGLSSYAEAIYN